MKSETLEKELKNELDRWSREDRKLIQHRSERMSGNTLSFEKKNPDVTVLTLEQDSGIAGDDEVTDDPLFVKEPPIDMWGAWRRVYYCNAWWVVGHYLMHPCDSEREADRVCNTLQATWDES